MEGTLISWIDWMNAHRARLCKSLIQNKALEIVQKYERQLNCLGSCKFLASNGWFHRFCQRTNTRSIKCSGEGAAVDLNVVSRFVAELSQTIRDNDLNIKQIFNVDELGLFWKLVANHTFAPGHIKIIPGCKMAKKRISILV